ncbi:hypothetical protein AAC387_Pa03g2941 [Persea americana]
MNMKGLAVVVLVVVLVLVLPLGPCQGALQEGYYKGKCGSTDVEDTIKNVVLSRFNQDRSIMAALLRMQFHDCFVKGCDASILLDGSSSEKTAIPNLSVRGYDIIDKAKAALEKACPGVVSCADIIIAATRDAVSGGERYEIQTGRKDGLVSQASNVSLPSPSISVSDSIAAFATKGLTTKDMVLLLGGHTVGVAHCSLFQDRLYNYQGTGQRDPNMSLLLAVTLGLRCPKNASVDNTANLDQNPLSALVVDNDYYKQLLLRRGVLQIDQALAMDARTRPTVASLAFRSDFTSQFAEAMIKLGAVEVLTDEQGQIRRSCRSVN